MKNKLKQKLNRYVKLQIKIQTKRINWNSDLKKIMLNPTQIKIWKTRDRQDRARIPNIFVEPEFQTGIQGMRKRQHSK